MLPCHTALALRPTIAAAHANIGNLHQRKNENFEKRSSKKDGRFCESVESQST
jgi:hypothetical protein